MQEAGHVSICAFVKLESKNMKRPFVLLLLFCSFRTKILVPNSADKASSHYSASYPDRIRAVTLSSNFTAQIFCQVRFC
jgi:hypothetical protein